MKSCLLLVESILFDFLGGSLDSLEDLSEETLERPAGTFRFSGLTAKTLFLSFPLGEGEMLLFLLYLLGLGLLDQVTGLTLNGFLGRSETKCTYCTLLG